MSKTTYKPLRGKVIVRILGSDRDKSTKKRFKKKDGSEGFLYTTTSLKLTKDSYNMSQLEEMVEADARKSSVFVRTGIIEIVGAGVTEFKVGDTCLLDYNVDNSQSVFIAWDGEDKLVSLPARTVYYTEDVVAYANQHYAKDQKVADKGQQKVVTLIVAVIRDGEIIANDPYVILKHQKEADFVVGKSNILSHNKPEIIEREVLAVSEYSQQEYGIKKGSTVMVREADTFDIVWDGQTVTAVDDVDVLITLN